MGKGHSPCRKRSPILWSVLHRRSRRLDLRPKRTCFLPPQHYRFSRCWSHHRRRTRYRPESLVVISESNITTSAAATTNLTGLVFLGRPWSAAAQSVHCRSRPCGRVAYISCYLGALINPAGWEPWSVTEPNGDGVLFAEYDSSGPGAVGQHAPFSTQLNSSVGFGIADVLGENRMGWVDNSYYYV
ncbi:hypothetical protein K438DRAFT_2044464 [Mycena galopus ATCC 62051]|nr:hypothetical protein K438DRAFT_2044464 [Mycena galopus ATCC 62051]